MNTKRALTVLIVLLVTVAGWWQFPLASAIESPFASPLPAPSPTPLPSTEAQVALRYIAERYGIPVEQLAIVNEHRREYAELGRVFQAFTLLSLADNRFFNLLVDPEDHTVVEDVGAVQRAQEDAYRQRYGKLEPALYERLQQAADDEPIEVAIWIAGRPRRSQQELFAELAARFPEAQAAMERSGKPFDVQDPEVRARIEQAYDAMGKVDTQALVQPVVEFLQGQGYAVTTYDGLPSVTGVFPKQLILALSERPDVGRIFLIEGEGELLLDSAVPTDRVPAVWQRGFKGGNALIVAAVLWGLALPLMYLSWRLAKKRLLWVVVAAAATLTLSVLYLAACQSQEIELPFQTIAQGEGFPTGRSYPGEKPDLLIITAPEEVDTPGLEVQFPPDLAEQLRAVNYNDRFVIIVLRGQLGGTSPSYAIDVLEVVRSGNRVVVRTHFGELGPEEGVLMAFSSPYHILTVAKAGTWNQKIRFILEEDGKMVKERTHFVP
jgi:hypothetical protein